MINHARKKLFMVYSGISIPYWINNDHFSLWICKQLVCMYISIQSPTVLEFSLLFFSGQWIHTNIFIKDLLVYGVIYYNSPYTKLCKFSCLKHFSWILPFSFYIVFKLKTFRQILFLIHSDIMYVCVLTLKATFNEIFF